MTISYTYPNEKAEKVFQILEENPDDFIAENKIIFSFEFGINGLGTHYTNNN